MPVEQGTSPALHLVLEWMVWRASAKQIRIAKRFWWLNMEGVQKYYLKSL